MRKVYAILTTQLVITFGIVAIFQIKSLGIGDYFTENRGAYWIVFGVSVACICALSCCGDGSIGQQLNFSPAQISPAPRLQNLARRKWRRRIVAAP